MNEELQAAITDVINSMMGVAESAYQFGAEQMPEVVRELLLWEMMISVLFFLVGLGVMAGSIKILMRPNRWLADLIQQYEDGAKWTRFGGSASLTSIEYDFRIYWAQRAPVVISVIAGIGFGIALANLTWLKILVAPKVWLIEYAAGLVK